jgi:hypothetical protein
MPIKFGAERGSGLEQAAYQYRVRSERCKKPCPQLPCQLARGRRGIRIFIRGVAVAHDSRCHAPSAKFSAKITRAVRVRHVDGDDQLIRSPKRCGDRTGQVHCITTYTAIPRIGLARLQVNYQSHK